MELLEGKRDIGCKWAYKKKKEIVSEKEEEKCMARLVEKGYSQKQGVDYDEIFSLMVRHISIITVLSMVAYFNKKLEQMDVKTTFLHGELEETVCMVQLEGFTLPG